MDIEDYENHSDQFHSFSDKELTEISDNIVKWYQQNRRKLPWRGDQPPYSKTVEVKTTTKRDSKQASLTSFFSSKKQKLNNQKEDVKTYLESSLYVKQGEQNIKGSNYEENKLSGFKTFVYFFINLFIKYIRHLI